MSRYPGSEYPRPARSPPRWQQDRRQSYNEPPRRALRDAPPLGRGNSFRDGRDFSPRDARDEPYHQRRNSRDDPVTVGPGYSNPPTVRGGFGRGRGRGDHDYRAGRGRPRFPDEDRDYIRQPLSRDRSPPRYYRDPSRDRSPDRRDDRPFQRREDSRWNERNDRERDFDRARRPEPPLRLDSRPINDTIASAGPSPAALVHPDRLASIEDAGVDQGRRQPVKPNIPSYLNDRAENTSNRYSSRASSPPTQPPPVPAFTLSFAPPAPTLPSASKAQSETKRSVQDAAADASHSLLASQGGQKPSNLSSPRMASAAPSIVAPRAPRAATEASSAVAAQRPIQTAKSPGSLSTGLATSSQPRLAPSVSPVMQSRSSMPVPTGPKAERSVSQSSASPRMPFSTLNRDSAAPNVSQRSRTPPPSAPSGPRSHGQSVSPEAAFAAAPTAPRADRNPPPAARAHERPTVAGRTFDRADPTVARASSMSSKPAAWNWHRQEHTASRITEAEQQTRSKQEQQAIMADQKVVEKTLDAHTDEMDVEPPVPIQASAPGPSAHQSFIGQPAKVLEQEDDEEDESDNALLGSLSTTEDEDDMGVGDLALFEAKHERQRRDLESKLIDLSTPRYRATTPLEQIARLARITMDDVERFRIRENEMDIDEPHSVDEPSVPPATHSSESEEGADLPTPTAEEDTSVLIHDAEDEEQIIKRIRRPTPEIINLPYMIKTPQTAFHETEEYIQRTTIYDQMQPELTSEMQGVMDIAQLLSTKLEQRFYKLYQAWREECEELDHEREELERLERQASFEPVQEPEPMAAAAVDPRVEGRKLHKFSSQYDLDLILERSLETARIEQERAEQEARKNQADMEKEAILPDQMTADELQRSIFIDNNRLREPESLTVVFTYEPYPDDFTEKEQEVFTLAFKETPKKWSEIASLLPGREPKDCIRHYYANKWDGRFRDTRRKFRARRGRGGKAVRGKGSAAMADLSRQDDLSGPVAMSDSGRPKRAAAPTTFGERESEAKMQLAGQSPIKRAGPSSSKDGQADGEKPVKRRRAALTDKPGRKTKGSQPLASLAAAPTLSPDGRIPQQLPSKESIERSRLEEASLLTGFHAGRPASNPDPQAMFAAPESYMTHRALDDPARLRAPMQAQSAKPSPSSYWSVPEQTDFNKYIKHFGTDFGAIAQHMGTKTQTMIKNHYQRQVDGGNRPDLEADANAANARRARGEDMGAPPVPTPIVKRRYDQPATSSQRSLVSHADQMEIDDGIGSRAAVRQHGSPPQFQTQSRYQPGAPGPPARVPSDSSSTPILAASAPSRSFQPQQRMNIFGDPRAEPRPGLSTATSFISQLSTPTGQSSQPSRSVHEAPNPQFIQSLLEEQRKAMRLQEHQGHYQPSERIETFHARGTMPAAQHSPPSQPALLHDRKPLMSDLRTNSPPALFSIRGPPAPARGFDGRFPHHGINPPLPKREDSRTSVGSGAQFSQPAEAPKRSNVMSLLNDTDEPKPSKRNSTEHVAAAIPRHGSPAQVPPPFNAMPSSRAEAYAPPGQPHFARPSIQGPAVSSSLKQEPLSASASGPQSAQSSKSEWRSTHGANTPPSGAPSYDRAGRPFFHHASSMLGQLGTRANPSPPPHASLQHSRTPSLSTAEVAHTPYAAGGLPGQPPLRQPSLYGQQTHSQPPFSQAPPAGSSQAPSHAPHHPPALGGAYTAHQRGPSRDDRLAPGFRERERDFERDRDERDWRYRQQEDDGRRRAEMNQQRQYEQERQWVRPAPPSAPQALHPPFNTYEQRQGGHDVGMSMREQSRREAEMAIQHEEERMRSTYNRDRDRESEDARRRHDDAYMTGARRTPLGGGFGPPGSNLPLGRR